VSLARQGNVFSLVASGWITLRRIDGCRKIAAVLSQHTALGWADQVIE
jgi:hypothetical protein